MKCRHCHATLQHDFLDLGFAPPSNAYLSEAGLSTPELWFPLKLKVCGSCHLVQTLDYSRADELFTADYAYFSSVSSAWLAHAQCYVDMIVERLQLHGGSHVVEIASNDGYLLKNFVAKNIPCLGIEPTAATAEVAQAKGIPVLGEFFGEECAQQLVGQGKSADLIIGNNVYAHVPDINDFTRGLQTLLKPGGVITLEFPHLLRLMEDAQFDTVYHEHFSYLSLHTAGRIFAAAGLRIFDVERLETHGGSLRIYGCHQSDARATTESVATLLAAERAYGLESLDTYRAFQKRADQVKNDLLRFLLQAVAEGKKVGAYGAAAKGNTILNYAGVKPDLLPFVCDAAPSKQGRYMPGSHIPILPPAALRDYKPDYVLILPWNIAHEVIAQNAFVKEWGGRFVVAVPQLQVLP